MTSFRTCIGISWFWFLCLTGLAAAAEGLQAEPVKVRIGWQFPWATQGQVVQILKHTDILKDLGIQAEFIGKTFGPQLNELALAGAIDVVLTADQPAAALFAKDRGWMAVGRLMYNRTATYVPPSSPIRSLRDLKGKTIAVPMGAAAERVTYEALSSVGLNPAKDVKIVNLDILEQGPLLLKYKGAQAWGTIDALSGFDPTPAMFEARGLIRTVHVGKVVSLVLMQKGFLEKNPGIAAKIMQSVHDAYDYYRIHREQANTWFLAEARLTEADQKACDIAASIEPNVWVKSRKELRVGFVDEDFKTLQKAANFLEPKIGKRVDMNKYIDRDQIKEIK